MRGVSDVWWYVWRSQDGSSGISLFIRGYIGETQIEVHFSRRRVYQGLEGKRWWVTLRACILRGWGLHEFSKLCRATNLPGSMTTIGKSHMVSTIQSTTMGTVAECGSFKGRTATTFGFRPRYLVLGTCLGQLQGMVSRRLLREKDSCRTQGMERNGQTISIWSHFGDFVGTPNVYFDRLEESIILKIQCDYEAGYFWTRRFNHRRSTILKFQVANDVNALGYHLSIKNFLKSIVLLSS